MFTSCNDFLDKVPDTRVYLTTVEQLRQTMVDGYTSTTIACTGELSSDNVIDNNSPSDAGVRYNKAAYSVADDQIFAWEDVDKASDNDTPTGIWSGCYGAIAVCNAVLQKADQFLADGADEFGPLDQSEIEKLNAIRGEALVSRAYHHWLLTQFFCLPYAGPEKSKSIQGVTYITEPETTVNPQYQRNSLAECYDLIEKDLNEGRKLIDDQLYEVPKYHFNQASTNAFAARFYLFKRDYRKAADFATAAFKGSDPAQMVNKLWSMTNLYYISDIGLAATSIEKPHVMMCFSSYSTWWRRFVYSTQNRYTCNREAQRATLRGPGPTWENCRYQNSRTKESFAMHPAFNGYCGTAGGQEYGGYFAGNCFEQFEYTDKLAGIGYCHEVRAEFTTEETLLVRAEAYVFMNMLDSAFYDLNIWDQARQNNQSGDDRMVPLSDANIRSFYTKCLNDYNTYCDRTNLGEKYQEKCWWGIARPIHIEEICPPVNPAWTLDDNKLPYLQCIQHFRRLELVHTGMRFLDLKRLGIEVTHKIGRYGDKDVLTIGDPRWAIQIPFQSILAGYPANDRTKVSGSAELQQIKAESRDVNQRTY